jgi:thymidylate kinase
MKAPELVDATVAEQVLVYGSLPPHGRDLDLLVREPEERALSVCLPEAGFTRLGSEWARFAACSVEVVELTRATDWNLPADELTALFGEGLEIGGLHHLVRPSPHHTLLILARRIAGGDGVIGGKLHLRLEHALAEDPDAWIHAGARAEIWGARAALRALQGAWRAHRADPTHDPTISAADHAAARRERRRARSEHHTGGRARLRSAVKELPRPRRGAVVALSGLDGAGKSSQATALRDVLERLGHDAVVVRTRIAWDDSLWTIAGPIKQLLALPLRLLGSLRRARADEPGPDVRERAEPGPGSQERPGDGKRSEGKLDGGDLYERPATTHPVTIVREGSPLLTDLWTLMITLANASAQWKLMRRQLLRGGVVICDRYTLDSIVELRYSYGAERPFRGARAALALLYPKPVCAFFLDVSPEVALERKGEWGIQWLSEHRELYLQECERLGVRLLDGEQPQAEICAEVAREVWLSGI